MAHTGQPPLPPNTPLESWGWWLWNLANQFYWTGYAIKDTWLIGPALFQRFIDMSDPVYAMAHRCWALDAAIRVKWAWIIGLTEGWTLLDILDYFSFYYKWIRDDPTGFIKYFLGTIDFDRYWFLWDIRWWFRWRFTSIVGWLESFLDTPWTWLDGLLGQVRYWLRYFIDDPVGVVRSWIITSFPFLYDLYVNSLVWVINLLHSYTGWFWDFIIDPTGFVISFIRGIHYELSRFMNDPAGWFYEKLSWYLGFSYGELLDLPMTIFRRMMRQIQARRGEVEILIDNVVCDIICWFI